MHVTGVTLMSIWDMKKIDTSSKKTYFSLIKMSFAFWLAQ